MNLFSKKKVDALEIQQHFAINDSVKLLVRGVYYSSRVEEFRENSVWVACPVQDGRPIRLGMGDQTTLISSAKNGMNGYRCKVEDVKSQPYVWLCLAPEKALGRVQRRGFARVRDTLPVRFMVTESRTGRTGTMVQTTTVDLSGGGALLTVGPHERPATGDEIWVALTLPGNKVVEATAHVMRVEPLAGSPGSYGVGIGFSAIKDNDRQALIHRVFQREKELRHSR